MAEIRYNPFTGDYVMIASHRQARPQMPKDWCPFCPGSGKVPDDYDVYKYDNDFPALSPAPPAPDDVADGFFTAKEAYGKCEVILYSPDHYATLPQLTDEHMQKLVALWIQRYAALASDPRIKFVLIFENKGEVVGVTMPHPHGQIYGFPFVSKKIELEVAANERHMRRTGKCLLCDWLDNEIRDGRRVVFENEHFAVILPFFAEYPYGVHIAAKRHFGQITELAEGERLLFGKTVKQVAGMYDCLFDMPFPYMMTMHQAPVNPTRDFHFHVEFFPPMRAKDKQKFNASSETGAWTHCNPTCPEEKAIELREAHKKFMESGK